MGSQCICFAWWFMPLQSHLHLKSSVLNVKQVYGKYQLHVSVKLPHWCGMNRLCGVNWKCGTNWRWCLWRRCALRRRDGHDHLPLLNTPGRISTNWLLTNCPFIKYLKIPNTSHSLLHILIATTIIVSSTIIVITTTNIIPVAMIINLMVIVIATIMFLIATSIIPLALASSSWPSPSSLPSTSTPPPLPSTP